VEGETANRQEKDDGKEDEGKEDGESEDERRGP
jgi:hypothetical protein